MSFQTFSCCNLSSLFFIHSAADTESGSCHLYVFEGYFCGFPPSSPQLNWPPFARLPPLWWCFLRPPGVVTAVTWALIPVSFHAWWCEPGCCFIRAEQSVRVLLQVLLGCARGESQVVVAGEDALNLFPACTGNHRVCRHGREVTQT